MNEPASLPLTKRFFVISCRVALIAFALLLAPATTQAQNQSPDDQYLAILTQIRQADSLLTNNPARALTKYREAYDALERFRRTYPERNQKTVAYRTKYLTDKINVLSQPAAESAEAGTNQPSGTPGSGAGMQVKLVEPGGEPRKVLRLRPKAGDKQAVAMTMKLAIAMKMGEMETPMKLPPMNMAMDSTIKSVAPNGDISFEMVVTDAGVAEDPDVLPEVANAVKASLGGVKGMASIGVVSDRGINKKFDSKIPADADPQMRQTMEQMKDSLANLGVPLPEEAIGPGAKWEASGPIKSQGMTINQSASYELIGIEGEQAKVKCTISQSAINQKISNPSMPSVKSRSLK